MSTTPSPEGDQPQSEVSSTPPPDPGLSPASPQQSAVPAPDAQLRKEAKKRIKAKKQAKQLTGVFLIIWAMFIGIWIAQGMNQHFWPIYPILAMSVPLGFAYWGAYGPSQTITDSQVDEEMRRMEEGR